MHFSIPDTRLQTFGNKTFITYNIHINGTYHCSLRYRQLYQFYIQLRKLFGEKTLSEFPPKKLFQLTANQLEDRRSQLEKFLQIASQDSRIVQCRLFNGFLLAAQQESFENFFLSTRDNDSGTCSSNNEQNNLSTIDIYQLNWQSTVISVNCFENSDVILSRFCRQVKLETAHVPYFGLFLVQRIDNDYRLVRPLESFESPLLTLKWINKLYSNNQAHQASSITTTNNKKFVIIIKKSYWNPLLDEDLFQERFGLNILYWQALHEIEKGHVSASRETRNKLTALQAKGEKIEYLKIARTLRHYGHAFFDQCYCDYPSQNTAITLCAGNYELCFRMSETQDEVVFRVVRIKCWRLTTITPSSTTSSSTTTSSTPAISSDSSKNDICDTNELELSFEYLISKGQLKWITIRSKQAILLSSILQSMVEEMLHQKNGKIRNKNDISSVLHYNTSPSYSSQIDNGNINRNIDKETITSSIVDDNDCRKIKNNNENINNSNNNSKNNNTKNNDNFKIQSLVCSDDWKFVKTDGTFIHSKGFKLCDDIFTNTTKIIQIDNNSHRIHYNANLVFNDIADEDL